MARPSYWQQHVLFAGCINLERTSAYWDKYREVHNRDKRNHTKSIVKTGVGCVILVFEEDKVNLKYSELEEEEELGSFVLQRIECHIRLDSSSNQWQRNTM